MLETRSASMTSACYCYGRVAAAATVSAAGTARLSGTPNVNRFLSRSSCNRMTHARSFPHLDPCDIEPSLRRLRTKKERVLVQTHFEMHTVKIFLVASRFNTLVEIPTRSPSFIVVVSFALRVIRETLRLRSLSLL